MPKLHYNLKHLVHCCAGPILTDPVPGVEADVPKMEPLSNLHCRDPEGARKSPDVWQIRTSAACMSRQLLEGGKTR